MYARFIYIYIYIYIYKYNIYIYIYKYNIIPFPLFVLFFFIDKRWLLKPLPYEPVVVF